MGFRVRGHVCRGDRDWSKCVRVLGASVDLVSKGTYLIQLGVYNDGYGYLL